MSSLLLIITFAANYQGIKYIKAILIFFAIVISVLITSGFLLFYVSAVQTAAANVLANFIRKNSGISISIERVQVEFPNVISLNGVLVNDLNGDTLLSVENLNSSFVSANEKWSRIELGASTLDSVCFNIVTLKGDSVSNLERVIDKITPAQSDSSVSFSMLLGETKISNSFFRLQNEGKAAVSAINFDSLQVQHINAELESFELIGDSLYFEVQHLSGSEPQGLLISEYNGGFSYSNKNIGFHNFQLRTSDSRVDGDLQFNYDNPSALRNFNSEVKLEANVLPSVLVLDNLAALIPAFSGLKDDISLRGNFNGTISELQGNEVIIEWGNTSFFRGNLYTYGLPQLTETFIDFDVQYMKSNYDDLVYLDVLQRGDSSLIPVEFKTLGTMEFKGNFTGFTNDFVAYGALDTKIGTLISDISVDNTGDTLRYDGELEAKKFNLGTYFKNRNLGALSAALKISGQGITLERLKASVKGEVKELGIKNYSYRDLALDGDFSNQTFQGNLNSLDKNVNFEFNGLVDFGKSVPHYDFTADIYAMELSKLNFLADTLQASFTGQLNLKGKGKSFEGFEGIADARNISFCAREETFNLGDVLLNTEGGSGKDISLSSELGTVHLKGELQPKYLMDDLKYTLADISSIYFPVEEKTRTSSGQDFTLEIKLTDAKLLSGLVGKDFNFEGSLELLGFYKSKSNEIGITSVCQQLTIGKSIFSEIVFEGTKAGSVTDVWLNVNNSELSEGYRPGVIDFTLKGVSDNFQSSLSWENPGVTQGELNGLIEILGKNSGSVDWLPSSATFKGQVWELNNNVRTYWDSTGLYFEDLLFENQFQELAFTGAIRPKISNSTFSLRTKNFALSNFNILTQGEPELDGVANGFGNFSVNNDSLRLNSDLEISGLAINGKTIGDLNIQSNQQTASNRIGFNALVEQKNGSGKARLYGYYGASEEMPLNATVDLNDFDVRFLEGQFTEDVTQLEGKAFGTVKVKGRLDAPKLSGKIRMKNGHIFIPYLQSGFSFTDDIIIKPTYLGLNYIDLVDETGAVAKLTGTVFHENFTEWNYDFFAEMKNNRVIKTTRAQNSTFYGTVFATGTIDIAGYGTNTVIEVSAKPEKNTLINIPLDGVDELESLDYVEFIDPNKEEEEEEERVDLSGLSLNLDLDVNNNAEIKLIFDEKVGDIISATGSGLINMRIDSRSNFEMFGRYEVEDGDYLFTLENLVNKKFNVQQGSEINWFGDPYEAILDIYAEYNARAPLYDILAAADDRYKRREPVIVQMHLTERLINPDISFNILLPNADDFVRGQVRSVISNEQEMNRQVFSILVLQKFVPPLNSTANADGSRLGSSIGNSTSELISNQLSNIASQISSDFNLGINYRAGDELSRNEVAVAINTQLANERVNITSNFGVTDRTASNPNGLVGDVTVEYSLTKDGRLRMSAFNETADNIYNAANLSPFIQGVGLSYRTEFETLSELWQRFKMRFRRKGKKEEQPN